ncbi:5-oxoprolinase subunit PxpB [Aquimarina longa]|uniref:5-oxoprolinase subunit PxpB n=1 Tax=Aquimarina longa TaxID=1080221 RepID=UPI000780C7F0|nr:5-oxoprolinase subunit PxpB [Aquimarina longa]
MKYELQYKRYSEKTILIEWPSGIDKNTLHDLLLYKKSIESFYDKLIVEVVVGYNSLLVLYTLAIEDIYSSIFELKSIYDSKNENVVLKNKLWKIPVCYSLSLASDLKEFSESKSLTIDEVVTLHTTPFYTVYFIGFLPGFLYLGGLDSQLQMARKTTPSLSVKKGSVAIGGNQTGVYPIDSPGGWHVIGMSPIDFFKPSVEECCFISSGDVVQFISIEEQEYNAIKSDVISGKYIPKSISI